MAIAGIAGDHVAEIVAHRHQMRHAGRERLVVRPRQHIVQHALANLRQAVHDRSRLRREEEALGAAIIGIGTPLNETILA